MKCAILSIVLFGMVGNIFAGPSVAEINRTADALRGKLIEQRRDFHMHPELSGQEKRTSQIVAEKLRALGLDEIKTNVAGYGVVALLKGGKPGAVVAVRADLDALPINETMNVPYCSLTPGVKHACGHDVHTTIELGVAEILSKMRDQIPGTIKFIFQPAEEGLPSGEEAGAKLMVKEGVLENPRPLAIFGLHTTTEIETGQIGVRSGAAQAALDSFTINIKGLTAHPAYPNKGVDAVVVASECVIALQTIKSRRTETFEPVILNVGTMHGGKNREVMAPDMKMEGSLRTFNESTRKSVKQLMRQTLEGICAGFGAGLDLKINETTMLVYNDPKLVEESVPAMRRAIGETNVIQAELRMGGEDFSYYQQVISGFLYRLGSGNKAKGIIAQQHTAEFDVDEECLVVGVKAMANMLCDFLEQHSPAK